MCKQTSIFDEDVLEATLHPLDKLVRALNDPVTMDRICQLNEIMDQQKQRDEKNRKRREKRKATSLR